MSYNSVYLEKKIIRFIRIFYLTKNINLFKKFGQNNREFVFEIKLQIYERTKILKSYKFFGNTKGINSMADWDGYSQIRAKTSILKI